MSSVRQRRHDRHEPFAAVDEVRIEHSFGGVIDGGDEGVVLRWAQGEPAMATAIKVHELAEAGARLAPAPMPTPGAMFGQQPRPLQRDFDVRIGQRDAVLAPRDVMEVTGVEARVVLAIELQKALHFVEGRLAR